MTQKIQFDLVSPESKIVSEAVTMAVIPGTEGDFGIMGGHKPLVANVGTGIVEIYRDDMESVDERIFIAGGVADVTAERCTLLAEQAVNVNDIDKADLEREIADINDKTTAGTDEMENPRLHKKLAVLNAMMQVA